MDGLTRRLVRELDALKERVNQSGSWWVGTVTATHTSPNSVDVRVFESGAEGSVILEEVPYLESYTPTVGDVVVMQEWGNGRMEEGAGPFFVYGAKA